MKCKSNTNRRGANLVEVLIIIALIAVLAGLLVPAVQKVRETANRIVCANNLRQLGMALTSYHDNYGRFPAENNLVSLRGWAVDSMNYTEDTNLYRTLKYERPPDDPWNVNVAKQTRPHVLSCPSSQFDSTNLLFPEEVPITPFFFYAPLAGQRLHGDRSSIVILQEAPAERQFLFPYLLSTTFPFSSPDNPSTNHAGGYNTLFGDGHTDFIRPGGGQGK